MRSPKALVVNPWVTDFKLYDEWMHPIGLYFLMSILRHNGWEIEYLNFLTRSAVRKSKRYSTGDFDVTTLQCPRLYDKIPRAYKRYGLTTSELDSKLNALEKPDVIFVGSGMTYWCKGMEASIGELQKRFPSTPVIVGGLAARLIPSVLRKRSPDITVFPGRLPESLDHLAGLHPLLYGLTLPPGPMTMSAAFDYCEGLAHGPILASLGCPMRCTYCASSHLEPSFAPRPTKIVFQEIARVNQRFGARDFALYDDAFLFQHELLARPLLQAIIDSGLSIRLHAPNGLHARWLTPSMLSLMKKAGFVTIRIGYECGADKFKKDTTGKTTAAQLRDTIGAMHDAGFADKDTGVYVMSGLPGQKPEEALEEIAFVGSLGVRVKPVFLSPVPGSQLFEHYANSMPILRTNPMTHNDMYFTTTLPDWDWESIETIRREAGKYAADQGPAQK